MIFHKIVCYFHDFMFIHKVKAKNLKVWILPLWIVFQILAYMPNLLVYHLHWLLPMKSRKLNDPNEPQRIYEDLRTWFLLDKNHFPYCTNGKSRKYYTSLLWSTICLVVYYLYIFVKKIASKENRNRKENKHIQWRETINNVWFKQLWSWSF